MQTTSKQVTVLPQLPPDPGKRLRAAVYCRVSTKAERQERSLQNQIEHYRQSIGQDPRYELVEIYHDFGVSGFKWERPGFQRMVAAARAGCFDLVITKAVTRFARNTATALRVARMFRELGIGIYFELQGINTLTQAGELMLTLYAAFGQADSEGARRHALMWIEKKYRAGQPTRRLERSLGYAKTPEGDFVPDRDAPTVVEIFELAAEGFTVGQIAQYLNAQGRRAKQGGAFHRSSVLRILRNEAYKGDFAYQKFYVDEARRLVPNRGQRPRYYIQQDHLPLVSARLWQAAQRAVGQGRAAMPQAQAPPPLSDHAYPYRGRLFCAGCGHRLSRAVRAGRVLWECSGKTRFTQRFCPGVSIPQEALEGLLPPAGSGYFAPVSDRGRPAGWHCIPGAEWALSHRKKRHHTAAPALTEQNYPYKDRIFCKYCGGRLRRIISNAGKVRWICDTLSRSGKAACKGVRIPDERLQPLRALPQNVYIGKERIDGEERYGYSSKPDQRRSL